MHSDTVHMVVCMVGNERSARTGSFTNHKKLFVSNSPKGGRQSREQCSVQE